MLNKKNKESKEITLQRSVLRDIMESLIDPKESGTIKDSVDDDDEDADDKPKKR